MTFNFNSAKLEKSYIFLMNINITICQILVILGLHNLLVLQLLGLPLPAVPQTFS